MQVSSLTFRRNISSRSTASPSASQRGWRGRPFPMRISIRCAPDGAMSAIPPVAVWMTRWTTPLGHIATWVCPGEGCQTFVCVRASPNANTARRAGIKDFILISFNRKRFCSCRAECQYTRYRTARVEPQPPETERRRSRGAANLSYQPQTEGLAAVGSSGC